MVLEKIASHPVDDIRVARHFLVEDARPDKGVQLELWLFNGHTVDVEVEVQVVPYRL